MVLMAMLQLVPARSEGIDRALQAKIDAQVQQVRKWAEEGVIVEAVRAHNAGLSPEAAAMNQNAFLGKSILDPFVRGLMKNPAAELLRAKKNEQVVELFLSGADGKKAAFVSKPTNWCHTGKPKQDVPMSGKEWQGPIEVDVSTGFKELQVAVPVIVEGRPAGVLVVGLNVAVLAK